MVSSAITGLSFEDFNLLYLVLLLIIHFLSDFYLQKDEWVKSRNEKIWKSPCLYYHAAVVGFLSFAVSIFFFNLVNALIIAAVIFVSHFIIDGSKASFCSKREESDCNNVKIFVVDQVLHILIIFGIWFTVSFNAIAELLCNFLNSDLFLEVLIILVGYIIVLRPSGFFIKFFTKSWTEEVSKLEKDSGDKSLENGGRYIGYLERFLIYTLVLFQQYIIIGFIVAAKSILRYSNKRIIGEYVILGTFLSFSISIGIGIIVKLVLNTLGFNFC